MSEQEHVSRAAKRLLEGLQEKSGPIKKGEVVNLPAQGDEAVFFKESRSVWKSHEEAFVEELRLQALGRAKKARDGE